MTTPELLGKLEHFERATRRLRAPQHTIINQLDAQAGEEELGGTLRCTLADRLRITKAEAKFLTALPTAVAAILLPGNAVQAGISVKCTGPRHFTRGVHLAVPRAQDADSESDDLRRPAWT